MKKPMHYMFVLMGILSIASIIIAKADWPVLKGPYLGQKPPGNSPQIFAPNIVSNPGEIEFACAVSPCGKEIYFTRFFPKKSRSVIMVTLLRSDRWTIPKPAQFSGKYRDREPFISPDNRRLFFTSDRPGINSNKLQKGDIWYVVRTASGWSDPVNAGPEINTDDREGHPTIASSKTIYFHRIGKNGYDIFRAEFVNGKYNPAEKLGDAINTTDFIEGEPFIAPDESFLIFISAGRADKIAADTNTCDLYISFRKKNREWTPAKIMGSKVLSESEENWPRVSPDGKYLFFSSNRGNNPPFPDIYWINAGIIDELKPKELK